MEPKLILHRSPAKKDKPSKSQRNYKAFWALVNRNQELIDLGMELEHKEIIKAVNYGVRAVGYVAKLNENDSTFIFQFCNTIGQ